MTPDLVWRSIDVTIGLSALIMALLLIGRVIETRRQRAAARDRARGQATLQAFMLDKDRPEVRVDLLRHAEAVVQALSVIRGQEADRLIERLREVGLIEAMAKRLRHQGRRPDIHLIEAYAHLARPEDAQALLESLPRARGAYRRRAIVEGLLRAGAEPDAELTIILLGGGDQITSMDCALIESVASRRPDEVEALIARGSAMTPEVCAALATGLGRTNRFSAIGPLSDLSGSADDVVAVAAVEALGELGHPLAGAAVLHALYADNPRVRLTACRAAAQLRLTGLIDALTDCLDDPDWDVRFEASQALVSIGSAGLTRLRKVAKISTGRSGDLARVTLKEAAA